MRSQVRARGFTVGGSGSRMSTASAVRPRLVRMAARTNVVA